MTTLINARHSPTALCTLLATVLPACAAVPEPSFTAITDSPISESYAFSAAWGDYDGDGLMDLLFVDPFQGVRGNTQIYVFKNKGDGSFEKRVLDGSQFQHTGYLNGALWGDYDNDGRLDILINGGGVYTGADRCILLHQESDGSFSRASSPSFPVGVSHSGLWADFDADGLLDIFAGYWTQTGSPAVTDILWRNNGNGTFTDSMAQGISHLNDNDNSAMAATTGDFNGDGRTDLIVTGINQGRSRLYVNNGGLSFERILITPSVSDYYGNGIAAADYDNDGDLDFLTVSKSGDWGWTCACDGPLSGYSKLWRNNGLGEFEQVVAGELGNADTIGANGAAWADYNNDGWLDVIVIRGTYGNGRGHDPSDVLYRNNSDGTFSRVLTGALATEDGDARAAAWADYDNDGDMDLAVANYDWQAPGGSDRLPLLYRNEGNENHWVTVRLTGTSGNRDAVGAKVRVRATIGGEDIWQLREIRSNTGWIASQNDMRPHFGLGDATVAEVVRIEWPSGTVQELTHVAADQILTVVEPPRLKLESDGQLSWPASAEGYGLESAAAVDGTWSDAAESVEIDGGSKRVTIQPEGAAKFYRLKGQ